MPGLLEPLLSQIWMSVRGWGWILGLGSCGPDLGCGIGGGGGDIIYLRGSHISAHSTLNTLEHFEDCTVNQLEATDQARSVQCILLSHRLVCGDPLSTY